VYRLVRDIYLVRLETGEWRPTKDAFLGGPEFRISVDRAKLRDNDPTPMLQDETDSICRLIVEQVRGIDVGSKMTPTGDEIHPYTVRVDATPTSWNIAHADIYAHPERATKKAYRRLRDALSVLAEWEEGFAPSDRGG
jgi:hypothetical protein